LKIIIRLLVFIISLLILNTCKSTANNNLNINEEWLISEIINELRKDENTQVEIINNRLLWYSLESSEEFYIFSERIHHPQVLLMNLNNFIYTFKNAEYLFDKNAFKISFINRNGTIKEILTGIRMSAKIYYDFNTNEITILGYSVYNKSIDASFLSFSLTGDRVLLPNQLYSIDGILELIEFYRQLEKTPLLRSANQLHIGQQYITDSYVSIRDRIDNYNKIAFIQRNEFVLRNFNENRNNIFPTNNNYPIFEYKGNETFVTQGGFLRSIPVYEFHDFIKLKMSGDTNIRFSNTPTRHNREIYEDYGNFRNNRIMIFDYHFIDTLNHFDGGIFFQPQY